jgi:hypothetical protein
VKLSEGTKQQDLVITLLLHNEKIRRVIDTVGKKGVLLLGRFTEGRISTRLLLRRLSCTSSKNSSVSPP